MELVFALAARLGSPSICSFCISFTSQAVILSTTITAFAETVSGLAIVCSAPIAYRWTNSCSS
jgi:hypothetical protein